MSGPGCTFSDPVHGYIELDPLLVDIMHTPQFERLKDIKQLGATYWVYPGASHNRFEHCMGTAYLAGVMIETLRDRHQGTIDITPEEVLCVKIAGLCHDLGHGPFSHMFDSQMKAKFMQLNPNDRRLAAWEHEDASCEMFDYMLKENPDLLSGFKKRNINDEEQQMIKEMIRGKMPGKDQVHQMADYNGTSYPKWFLFEIVANKRNGIDVDKFDYFARDCLNLGVSSNFNYERYLQNVRILPVDDQLQICARDKVVFNIYELFHTRWSLHHRVYQHKTVKAVEEMISEAFALVDCKYGFSKAIFNMEEYSTMTDSIFYDIIHSSDEDENTKKAQELLYRIQSRDLYKFCGEAHPVPPLQIGAQEISQEISSFHRDLRSEDIFVSVVEIHFGMKDKDPVDSVVFFNKNMDKVMFLRQNVSEVLPQQFIEQSVRVYAKNPNNIKKDASPAVGGRDLVKKCFSDWCKEHHFSIPELLPGDKTGYFTPAKPFQVQGKTDNGVEAKRARKGLFPSPNSG